MSSPVGLVKLCFSSIGVCEPSAIGGDLPTKPKNSPPPGNPKWGPTPHQNSPRGGGEFFVFRGDQVGSTYFGYFDYSPPSEGDHVGSFGMLQKTATLPAK